MKGPNMIHKLLLICALVFTSAYAIEERNIKPVMDKKIKQVIKVLKIKSYSQSQKEKKSIKILDPIFSYPTMAKISLGTKWKTLTAKQKKDFTKAFEKKIKLSYIDKLQLYDNQKFITSSPKKVKHNRITLTTKIVGNGDTYEIINYFYKKKNTTQWYVYDVKLAGVSVIQTYRKQFKDFLKTKSFKQLLNSL
jgi:phospholipid transport system substrate-binding protein